jgi:hypothetical protein
MKTVTLPSLARQADAIFAALDAGERFVVKHRGSLSAKDAPFYSLGGRTLKGGSRSNAELDRAVYGV